MMSAATDQLANQALAALQGIINTAIQVGDFVKGQFPQVIHELLTYNMWLQGLNMFICAAIWGASWKFNRYCVATAAIKEKKLDKYDCYRDTTGWYVAAWGPPLVASVCALLAFVIALKEFILILFAPRVWLIEYAANLMK
jgi:hypothetical protein